jgi:E3 ubiquitin-protein ligase RGLG
MGWWWPFSKGSQESKSARLASRSSEPASAPKFIPDQFHSLEEVQAALRGAGLESSNLVVGIDFTSSNSWTGKRSFNGKSLHHQDHDFLTPYAQAVRIIGKTLSVFDDDNLIPCYGFGCDR